VCAVMVAVQPHQRWGVVALAVRDEFLDRPWDPFGPWWPALGEHVIGLRDRDAGGAWLAANPASTTAFVDPPMQARVIFCLHESLIQATLQAW